MSTTGRPNILVVIFDSLGQADFEALAGDLPRLSALRASSLNFSNTFVCSPEHGPARASLFTGLDMAAHGVWTDGVALPGREAPFPELFASNGYHTWLVGRRQLAGVSNWTTEHARPGEYHQFDWAHGPLHRSRQNQYLAWLEGKAPETCREIFPRQPNPDDTTISKAQREAVMALPDPLSFNTWVGTRACELVKGHPLGSPFLGVVGFVVGETMGATPTDGATTEGVIPHALQQADAAVGQILETAPDNTVVVVTAGRGSSPKTAPMSEDAIRVPLMVRSGSHGVKSVDGIVSTMDIAPTLFEIAKIRPPQRMQGMSLLGSKPRGWALSRLRNPDQPHQTALRTDGWKLVMTHGDLEADGAPSDLLYDLRADPDERQDLAARPEHSETLEELVDQMIDARVALEDRTEPRIATF